MNKRALFERTRSLWSEALGSDVARAEARSEIYWRLEDELRGVGDDWTQLAAWAFNQALDELAGSRASAGLAVVHPDDVPFDAFDRWMRFNLANDSWAEIRAEYDDNEE